MSYEACLVLSGLVWSGTVRFAHRIHFGMVWHFAGYFTLAECNIYPLFCPKLLTNSAVHFIHFWDTIAGIYYTNLRQENVLDSHSANKHAPFPCLLNQKVVSTWTWGIACMPDVHVYLSRGVFLDSLWIKEKTTGIFSQNYIIPN